MLLVLPTMLLYVGFLLLTGHLLLKAFCRRYENEPLACLPLGMAAALVLVALCSIVHMGTPLRLRIVFAAVFAIELALCRKKIVAGAGALFRAERREEDGRPAFFDSAVLTVLIFAFLSQVGRAGITLDYDSLWYGLRSDVMLAPFTGIYDRVIASGLVYSYTKGIEALSLVFDFEVTHSFVQGVNLLLGALLLYALYRTARLFLSRRHARFVAMLVAVTPGVMNMTVTAKPDIATLLTQVLAVYFTLRALKEKDGDALLLAVAAALLSFCFKSSAIVFTTLLLLVAIPLFLLQKIRIRPQGLLLLLFPAAANIFLMARTFLITGMPLTQMGAGLFEALGFSYRFPYAPASSDYVMPLSEFFTKAGLTARVPRLLRFFFAPIGEEMDHVAIAWGGLLFAVAWVALVVCVFSRPRRTLARMKEDTAYAFLLISTAVISAVSLGAMLLLQKPDGNYFMLMYTLTFLQIGMEARDLSERRITGICKCAAPLALAGLFLVFSTNWAGSAGFTPVFDRYNAIGFYEHAEKDADMLSEAGLGEIADRLKNEGGRSRVMLFSHGIPGQLSVPAISESFLDLCHWGNAALYESADGLASYFDAAGVEYLIAERAFLEDERDLSSRLLTLSRRGQLQIENDGDKYLLIRFEADGGREDTALCAYLASVADGRGE